MTVDIETSLTDYDWNEDSRPILLIDQQRKTAILYVAGAASMRELPAVSIECKDQEELRLVLEGYRDIFEAAAKRLAESPKAQS